MHFSQQAPCTPCRSAALHSGLLLDAWQSWQHWQLHSLAHSALPLSSFPLHASKLWRRTWKHVCLTAVGQGEAPDGRRPPQVWCVAVSAAGDFAVSGGADRSLRVWRRTDEPFFVEEERERRLESMFEADAEVRHCCCLRRLRRCGSAAEAGCQGCGFVRDDKQQWPRYVMHQEPSIRTYRR
jgi:hypothetical protein